MAWIAAGGGFARTVAPVFPRVVVRPSVRVRRRDVTNRGGLAAGSCDLHDLAVLETGYGA